MIQDCKELYTLKPYPQSSSENKLYLNRQQLKQLSLAQGQKLVLQIHFSTITVETALQSIDASPENLYVSDKVFSKLTCYEGEPLWLAYSSNTKMVLGPTLGITVSWPTWKKINKIDAIEKRALLAHEKGIFFYCFHLSKVDSEKELVEAYYYSYKEHKWVKKLLPLPDVLYHRSTFPFNKFAQEKNTNNVYHKLWKNPKVERINSTYYFDKWKVYEALSYFEETRSLQPETSLFSLEELTKFLKKYPFCFVKGTYGRCGRQVLRVEKKKSVYVCQAGGSTVNTWKFKSIQDLYFFLIDRLGEELILQQGISLARIDNRPFDIRVLIQKNLNAQWTISALSFRIADPSAIVTNIAAGAEEVSVAPEENIYPALSVEKLEKYCRKVLLALEAYYGSLGEVGLDIGVDDEGELWLIEANGQPSSRGYREAATEEVCNQIFGLPLDYAKYLARHKLSR